MPHKKELSAKLREIQNILHGGEEMTRKRLEQLGEETLAAFDAAIKAVDKRINVAAEIKKQRIALRRLKLGLFRTLHPLSRVLRHFLSMPFIYAMIIPALILHLFTEVYQQVCFRLYDIPRVKSSDYFVFDRGRLPYLNWLEKLNCLYCSYVNNLFQYVVEIGGRTERYWCPIKYANRMKRQHSQYELFVDYLEADTFREKWKKLQDFSDLKAAQKPPR
jgi:hypothetical protein